MISRNWNLIMRRSSAGHYNTERFGVQALSKLLQVQFGVETFFIDVPNDA